MGKLNWVTKACSVSLLWAVTAVALPAQTQSISPRVLTVTFTTLFGFDGTDGQYPIGALVQAANGNLYGTTVSGGTNDNEGVGGTVFSITPSGTLTTLYSFCQEVQGEICTDGSYPQAALVQATNGDFYGTTYSGGGNYNGCVNIDGCGTVFKISPGGTLATRNCTDGVYPDAGLVKATDGNFYGTTAGGGAHCHDASGCGTVFKMTADGTLTTLYSFDGTDGNSPQGMLVQGADGDLYGTTVFGGARHSGTVFSITAGGTLTTLYNFCSQGAKCTDGAGPEAGLTQGTDGNFYGTTEFGGTNGPYGTVFKITPGGTLTTLHNFCHEFQHGVCTDGAYPEGTLVQATDGNFYGTTLGSGGSDEGTIFQITPSGTLTTLYEFSPTTTGCGINCLGEGGLIQDTNGNFYGVTYGGGSSSACSFGCGTVYSLSVGLGPFVETNPVAGKVGAKIGILGTDLTGATSVTFNGITATFTVRSSTLIIATVPSRATSGTVQVQLPSGTLSSNVPFIVLP